MNLAELFADEDYRFQMALRRAAPEEFFRPTVHHADLMAQRKRWLGCEPKTYSAFLPPGGPLLDECIALAREWQAITSDQHEQLAALKNLHERCIRLGEIWEPDFLLLKTDAIGRLQLLGGCVCFPSAWSLAEKIGHPLDVIHAPVPGLNTQLGRSIDSILTRLAPGTAWRRHNWGLSRSPELNQHPSRSLPRLDESVTLPEVWLRVELQALVALPKSQGVLFGIRVAMHSLVGVKQDPRATEQLARALRTMPEGVAAYKGIAGARERILALLDARR